MLEIGAIWVSTLHCDKVDSSSWNILAQAVQNYFGHVKIIKTYLCSVYVLDIQQFFNGQFQVESVIVKPIEINIGLYKQNWVELTWTIYFKLKYHCVCGCLLELKIDCINK